MNKTLVLTIVLLTMIVIMASFDLSLGGGAALQIPSEYAGRALFVCPAENGFWDSLSYNFSMFSKYIIIGTFFCGIILMFVWGWAMYQNLLSDKFKKESFTKPWQFTKLLIWAIVILSLIIWTPNHFKTVNINVRGATGNWVLCEATSPGARIVPSDAVSAK
ncbi:MAG: hypothetical protein IJR92_00705 [Alphaproteobacteria bacterium]|nr:hypothetical protein [Alphaproteobacteria bacterium]